MFPVGWSGQIRQKLLLTLECATELAGNLRIDRVPTVPSRHLLRY